MSADYGTYTGSSSKYMNFLYDSSEEKVLICWEYPTARKQNRKFKELQALPDKPPNVIVMKGNPERVLGLKRIPVIDNA